MVVVEDLGSVRGVLSAKVPNSSFAEVHKGLLSEPTHIQVVAVDWIFSSRIKFVGLESILVTYRWWVGPGRFLTFWRSLEGSLGEQNVFKKTRFCQKPSGKL